MISELETKLITAKKEETISFLKGHPEYFEEAVGLAISDKQPYSWRAAFLLWGCMDENDKRIHKHIASIVRAIPDKKDGHQRELLKILYKMELKEKHEVIVFDLCLKIWQQIDKNPSVRITGLKFMFKAAEKYPELLNEITPLTEPRYLESLSPGARKSVEKMLQEII